MIQRLTVLKNKEYNYKFISANVSSEEYLNIKSNLSQHLVRVITLVLNLTQNQSLKQILKD